MPSFPGPAGGVVGMVETGRMAGFRRLIGFDMGGTSTDVTHFDGELERVFETEVAGVRMRAPMLRIHTVAAGGGSVLHFDGSRFRVGPDSAGANPGPACYRRGGPLALTDANLMLGRIDPEHFPEDLRPHRHASPSMPNGCAAPSPAWRRGSATGGRRRRWPRASSGSPSRTWPTPSRRSRSPAATT